MSVTHLARRTASTGRSAFLLLLPHGGQDLARRNAWASMSADATLARARRDADAAMLDAIARQHDRMAAHA